MTINATSVRKEYAGNGVTTAFSYPFRFLANGDLTVLLVDDATGVETVQTLTTHYTVTGAGDDAGGTVTFVTAPATGKTVVIYNDPDLTQGVNLVNNDPLPVETSVEAPLDRLTLIAQRLSDRLDRAVTLPDGDSGFVAGDMQLPAEVTRASKFLAFDADGKPIASTGTGTDTGLRGDIADTASAALGDALVGGKRTDTGAVAFTVHSYNENRILNVKTDFGATGDGVTDDATEVQAAVDAVEALGGGTLLFPAGTYLLGSVITSDGGPVQFVGEGVAVTVLKASHTSGPALHIRKSFSSVKRMSIDATAARTAGSAGTNFGILDEPLDTAGQEVNGCVYEQLRIQNHPSHGIAFVASYKGSRVSHSYINDCGGHGIFIDDGTALSRSNTESVGDVLIEHTRIFECTGHSIAAGSATTDAYRIVADNVDTFHCALTAGVRVTDDNMYFYGENNCVKNCGIGGWSGDSPSRVLAVGGIHTDGRDMRIINNRYIDVLDHAVEIGAAGHGTVVDGIRVTGESIVSLDPAVIVTSGATGVFVRARQTANITSAMTASVSNTGNRSDHQDLSPQGFRSQRQEVTIADDAVTTIEFTGVTRGILVLSGNSSSAQYALVHFRVGDNVQTALIAGGAQVAVTTGALTGTTGVDTNLTISAHTDNKLYIENRRGASLGWMVTFLSLANGELVL